MIDCAVWWATPVPATGDFLRLLSEPERHRFEAFRKDATIEEAHEATSMDPWFLRELRAVALDPDSVFAGERSFRSVDTCAAEFPARTPYFYSGWERTAATTAAPAPAAAARSTSTRSATRPRRRPSPRRC